VDADTFLNEVEQARKGKWQAAIDALRDDLFDAISKAVKAGDALKVLQLATAAGTLYDRLVPMPRGGALAPLVGGARAVQILVAAPPNPPGAVHEDVSDDRVETAALRRP
jgi:hypothetical protein